MKRAKSGKRPAVSASLENCPLLATLAEPEDKRRLKSFEAFKSCTRICGNHAGPQALRNNRKKMDECYAQKTLFALFSIAKKLCIPLSRRVVELHLVRAAHTFAERN